MSEEDRIELKKELSVYSKEELLEKYLDELEENHILTDQWYKSSQRLNKERETDIKYNKYLQKELAKAHSIIKEVKELLKSDYFEDGSFTTEKRVFELLDKVEEK